MNSTSNNLLMTATIDVSECPQVQRNNIEVRKNDYMVCLKNYLETTKLNIIFVENSGYDLLFLLESFAEFIDRLEIISIPHNTAKHVGKGQGEKDTILTAITDSRFLNTSNIFYKVSGRYYSPDIERVIIDTQHLHVSTITRDFHENNDQHISTVFFGCNKHYFKKFFNYDTIIRDGTEIFEKKVADMVRATPHADRYIFPHLNYINTVVSTGKIFSKG